MKIIYSVGDTERTIELFNEEKAIFLEYINKIKAKGISARSISKKTGIKHQKIANSTTGRSYRVDISDLQALLNQYHYILVDESETEKQKDKEKELQMRVELLEKQMREMRDMLLFMQHEKLKNNEIDK